MRALGKFVITLVVIAAIAAVAGSFLPSQVAVSRFVVINAPKSQVFTILDSLRAFSRWSPWTQRDPQIKFSFDGPDSGVGQKMKWQSHDSGIGAGTMEITDSLRDEKVVMTINFSGSANARSSLALGDVAGGTKVAWSFAYPVGGNPFARWVALMMPGAVGNEYARGLERLKEYAEAIPRVDFSDLNVERVSVVPRALVSVDATAPNTAKGMNGALAQSLKTVSAAIHSAGLVADGPALSVAESVKGNDVMIGVSYPVKNLPQDVKLTDGVHSATSEQGIALHAHYTGNYAGFQTAYLKLLAYALTNGWKVRGSSWNEYADGIPATPDAPITADIYLPVE